MGYPTVYGQQLSVVSGRCYAVIVNNVVGNRDGHSDMKINLSAIWHRFSETAHLT